MSPADLLVGARRLAVVGASATAGKPAHDIPAELVRRGWELVPVNPTAEEVLGRQAVASLADLDGPTDLVIVFRPSEEAPVIAKEAIDIGAPALWLQIGLQSADARQQAEAAGLSYVEDECAGTLARRLDLHPAR